MSGVMRGTLPVPTRGNTLSPVTVMEPEAVRAAFPEFVVDARPLGSGTFKDAYRVQRDDAEFVLKIVRQPVDDPDAALPDRLQREMEAMTKVASPRVVRVIEGPAVRQIGESHHVWYLEPMFGGGTLDKRVATPWGCDETVGLVDGLLEAVEALWDQQHLVHRDIKPANIAFDDDASPVLLDLGIALHGDLSSLTEPFGQSPRTPAYAAPEQFQFRKDARIDFRTDVFLIGLVAFETLTGQHPFQPNVEPEKYLERLNSGAFDTETLGRVDGCPGLKAFIARALQPRPNQRFRTFERARQALAGSAT